MKKRFLLVWLCAVITAGLLVFPAHADSPALSDLVVTGGTEGTDYEWRDSQLVILTDTPVSVRNLYMAETVTKTILISRNVSANVTLNGVNIGAVSGSPAVQIAGTSGNVTITLKGENRLTGGSGRAAIEKSGTDGKLTITGDGSLYAHGGTNAPGIGCLSEAVALEFAGGSVTAVRGSGAAADIGTTGDNPAEIRIAPTAAVKGDFSSRPVGTDGKRIGQLVLDNPGELDVTVDGTLLPYRVNPDDTKLPHWLPAGEHQVTVGSDSRIVPVAGHYGLTVTGGTEGTDYVYIGEDLVILTAVPLTVSNTDPASPTGDMIYISANVDADITLNGVNIDNVGALRIADDSRGNVQIRLAEGSENTLRASRGAGLQKNGTEGSLTISGKGKLDVYGGADSAGIGGGITYNNESDSRETANITIADGTVTVYSSQYGAGIGGGLSGDAGDLTITGGFVEAYSGGDGAAIGSGNGASAGNITISGGTVIAHAKYSSGAPIGTGHYGFVKKITISGGTVTAYAGGGSGIGVGDHGHVELIEITGGTVTADSGAGASAIGSGWSGIVDSIRISGGTVKAYYTRNSVAIGSGEDGHVGEIAITGGTVTLENSSSGWGDPATEWFAIGSDNKDNIKLIIKDCLVTSDGGIGCRNGGSLSLVIGKNASVRAAAIHAQAVNESGEPVYPLLIENPLEKSVRVGGEAFPYITNVGEKALCPFRPGQDISVTVGSETKTIPFDRDTLTFGTVHIPAAERVGARNATCTKDGYTGDLYCLGCGSLIETGESIPCPGHDCTMTVTREATLTKPGEVQMHCTVCGVNYKAVQRWIGDFIVSGIENDDDVTFSDGILTIRQNRTLMIRNITLNEPTTARIATADGVQARIILAGVHIDARSTGGAAVSLADNSSGSVRIELADGSTNLLFSDSGCAGLQKNGGSGTLTVTGTGTLMAVGGSGAAGIGSGQGHRFRNLIIENGNISVQGGTYGAGIGSGQNFSAENIRTTGGKISATGGSRACGIGHGFNLFGLADTENLVIGPMASVKASGPRGALGTDPVNEAGERVCQFRYTIPENGFLLLDRTTRFPYTSHDGEPRVFVYLTASQTAEPRSAGSSQLLTGNPCAAAVLSVPSILKNEDARANITGADAAGLDELAERYAEEGQTVAVILTLEELDETTGHADAICEKTGPGTMEYIGMTLTKQVGTAEPEPLDGDTPFIVTIPFDSDGVIADSVRVLRYRDRAERLNRDPADGEEGYTFDPAAGTITVTLKQAADLAVAYNLTGETPPAKPVKPIIVPADIIVPAKLIEAEEDAVPAVPDTPEFPFRDVDPASWSYGDIFYVWENGLMKGTSDTTFAPGLTTSRAMIVTILWRLEGEPYVNYAMSFADVGEDQWYTEAIRWAQATGTVNGYSAGQFGVNDPVTREQMAAIFCRYAAAKGCDVRVGADLTKFSDCGKVDDWAKDGVAWANAAGLMNGVGDTVLDPLGSAKREQVAAILHRFCRICLG